MPRMSRLSVLRRSAAAMLLALLLAVRLLSPAGFMPAFERGAVTIVACPDFDPPPAMPMASHHHHDPNKHHQACPYAAAAGAATAQELAIPAALILVGLALLLGWAFAFFERHRPRELPPSRAPPVPA